MLLDHFSLREQPFGVTPDPAYLYFSRTHRLTLEALKSGIWNDRGFMALIAQPGMGKTTTLYHLLDQLRDSARTVFIFQTQCDSREFMGHVLMELGISPTGMEPVAMHECLNKTLFSEMFAGRRVVLVVDEAQDLAEPVLETIRLLSNFETPHAKLLQIVFAGQPQLAKTLASPELAQLRQRIAVVARLEPFSADDTAAYIRHRLQVAGYCGEDLFTAAALAAIAKHSEGVPRTINNICFNALCLGFDRNLKSLDADIVREAVSQLSLEPPVADAAAPTQVPIPASAPAPALAAEIPTESANVPEPSPELYTEPDPEPANSGALTYSAPPVRRVNKSWAVGSAAIAILVLLGVWAITRTFGGQVKAASRAAETPTQRAVQQTVEPTLAQAPGATPQAMSSLQFLIVAVGPKDTIQDVSLRYLDRFDDEILAQIKALNPEVKNLNQMAPGQLLRLPFPTGTLKKVFDIDPARPPAPQEPKDP
jgi:general secretion pathway protein A